MPRSRPQRHALRGAAQIAVVFALLSLLLPARSAGVLVAAAAVGFALGLAAELLFAKKRVRPGR